jgi:hypothetical protein
MPEKSHIKVRFDYFDGIGIIPDHSDSYTYRKLAESSFRKNTVSRKFSKYNCARELNETQLKISGMICIIKDLLT